MEKEDEGGTAPRGRSTANVGPRAFLLTAINIFIDPMRITSFYSHRRSICLTRRLLHTPPLALFSYGVRHFERSVGRSVFRKVPEGPAFLRNSFRAPKYICSCIADSKLFNLRLTNVRNFFYTCINVLYCFGMKRFMSIEVLC